MVLHFSHVVQLLDQYLFYENEKKKNILKYISEDVTAPEWLEFVLYKYLFPTSASSKLNGTKCSLLMLTDIKSHW